MTEPGDATSVGAIVGYLRLDRTDWNRGVDETERDANRIGRLDPNVRVRTNAGEAVAQLGAVRAAEKGIGEDANKAKPFVVNLWAALAAVAPAAVPIAAVAGGALLGLLPTVGAVALGISGISDEFKSGQLAGTAYGQDIQTLQGWLAQLKTTAAGGLLDGLDRAVSQSAPLFGELNGDIGLLSNQIGDIVAGAAPALLMILHQLSPLFIAIGNAVSAGANQLEHWTQSSSGVTGFVAYVQSELPVVLEFLGRVITLITHIAEAAAPFGGALLADLTAFVGVLNKIPVDVLAVAVPAAISLYVALKAYQGITAIIAGVNAAITAMRTPFATSAAAAEASSLAIQAAAAQEAAVVAQAKAEEAAATASVAESQATAAAAAAAWGAAYEEQAAVISAAAAEEAAAFAAAAFAATASAEEITAAAVAAAEASTAEGAVAGAGWMAMLGPIGAVVIGVGILATVLLNTSHNTQQATEATNDYVTALVASKGALDDDVRASIAKRLADEGLIQAGNKLHITTNDLIDATLGNAAAQDRVKAALHAAAPDVKNATDGHGNLKRSFVDSTKEVGKLARGLGLEADAFDTATGKAKAQRDALAAVASSTDDQYKATAALYGLTGKTGVDAYLAAAQAAKKNTEQAYKQTAQYQLENNAAALLAQTLDKLSGKHISYAQAQNQFQQQLNTAVPGTGGTVDTSTKQGKLTAATEAEAIAQQKYNDAVAKGKPAQIEAAHLRLVRAKNAVASATAGLTAAEEKNAKAAAANSTSLKGSSEAAVQNRGNIISLIQSAEAAAQAYGDLHKSGEAGRKKLIELRQAIIDNAVAHGEDRGEVTKYINSLLKIPKKIPPTKFEIDKAAAEAAIKAFQRHVSQLHGKTVIINARVALPGGGFRVVGGAGVVAKALGGPITGPGPKGVDSVPLIGAPGEFMIKASAVDRFGAGFFQALNAGHIPPQLRAATAAQAGVASAPRSSDGGRSVVIKGNVSAHAHYPEPEPLSRVTPRLLRMAALQLDA